MATVFETKLIGNIGKDATVKTMDSGVVAINFPVAHNKNWKDKRSGEQRTNTTWINCTIWKREGSNMRVVDYLKRGTLVELTGTPFAKAFHNEDGSIRTEIRLNVFKTNILRAAPTSTQGGDYYDDEEVNEDDDNDDFDSTASDFSLDEDDF
ncbi:single-stranded DNA-binding protein [Crocinitomicaceae bacterium CZZ-1]|uniref:Single-stranded DNA-binding protein n=1 Tax=Taishania pollutisoli TaxID=2766479 RepID=A0A8J6TZZ7_9FLAO|nr:single-stranded DNA-binding protein [Taishania pollutisoli]MBC9812833.1 single-stranded DNA-binding protein [Taishania pollutisoli]MBX2949716.1 single-stranded DNA-binding protein [Crocinitomicaceae bacterium]NGF76136.1 single-stranded DNA-binding protein [Fluviicola sp. SGL-29]